MKQFLKEAIDVLASEEAFKASATLTFFTMSIGFLTYLGILIFKYLVN